MLKLPPQTDPLTLLAREGNGAIQVEEAEYPPIMVFLAGPIKQWWAEGAWDSPECQRYFEWRDAVTTKFVKAGFLVYSPHRAWRGSWHVSAQKVNNAAIKEAHVLVDLTPDWCERGDGTQEEIDYAHSCNTGVVYLGSGEEADIDIAVKLLEEA